MGAILSEAQIQSVDETAEFMRGVQVTELTGQSERIARLMVKAAEAEQRELKLADMLHAQQILTSAQDARIRQLEHEVKLLRGQIEPDMPPGFQGFMFDIDVDGTTVWCLARTSDTEEPERFNVKFYEPACPEVVSLWLNGAWISAEDIGSGPLMPEELDQAAEDHLKSQWQASIDRMGEERAYYRGLGV